MDIDARTKVWSGSRVDPRIGYYFAALNAAISGVAIYVNSLGVATFRDATLYTTLKNAVVGIALLASLLLVARTRAEWRDLTRRQWCYLLALAIIGGSVPYVLFFRGLQLTTPVTSSLLNHAQFLIVAILAVFLLGERVGPLVWLALAALLLGTSLGTNIHAVHWNEGAQLVLLSTLLFAAGVVLAKYLLKTLSMLTVMIAKMSLGSAVLLVYVAVTGRLGAVRYLSVTHWEYVLVTGLILLAFTASAFLALRYASATAATAIPAAAPIVTALLVIAGTHRIKLAAVDAAGLLLMVCAVALIMAIGPLQEVRGRQARRAGASV